MNDLRSEIRAAFEKEQASHPIPGGLRGNLTTAAATQTRPARNLQWIAVAVAAVLGILVVAGLMSTRLGPRGSVPGHTKATPVADYGPPPFGMRLLYVHDPNHPSWLIGYDWSGQPRGTVKLDPSVDVSRGTFLQRPDGSGFLVGYSPKGGTSSYLDRLGHPVAENPQPACLLSQDPISFKWILSTKLPGQQDARQIAVIARDTSIGQTGISIAACTFNQYVAILVRTVISFPSEMWVVRLSDGKILAHHAEPPSLANLVASSDGVFVAENSRGSTGEVGPGTAPTVIRRVSDWSVVATLGSSIGVLAFSGDDSLVLVSRSPLIDTGPALLSVIDLKSARSIWQGQEAGALGGYLAEPGTDAQDFAVYVFDPFGAQPDPLATILIIHGDGSMTKLPQGYEPAW